MKQKSVQAKPKTPLNGVQNQKAMKAKKDEQIKEEALAVAASPAKAAGKTPKKGQKTPVKAVPPKKVVEEEEDDESDEEDSGADVDNVEHDSEEKVEEDDDEDEEDDEQDEDDDEQPEGADEDASDDEPTEEPIKKDDPKAKGIYKINSGNVPTDMPEEQILVVTKLPKKFKQIDIVEVFAKFGQIHTIKPVYGEQSSHALVAFNDADTAKAALEATNKKAQVKGVTIEVKLKSSGSKKQKKGEDKQQRAEEKQKLTEEFKQQADRTMYVKNLAKDTTQDQLRAHFEECGEIQTVKVVTRPRFTFGFVTFVDTGAVEAAKQLHNTVMNGATIGVYLKDEQQNNAFEKDPKRTVLIKNTQDLKSLPGDKLATVFAKCGEIEHIDVLCKKVVLAFITFKTEAGAKKALKMNGTTAEDLELEIVEYKIPEPKRNTSIFIQHIKPGVTEEEIRELFADTGAIESIFIKGSIAIVKFQDTDGFCKSFLHNEAQLQGQVIFIEPYSDRKQIILKKLHKNGFGGGNKRKTSFNKNYGGQKKFRKDN